MRSEEFKWPPTSRISLKNGKGKELFASCDRDLDLSDTLMLRWKFVSRTVYFGLRTFSKKWKSWDEENIKKVEWLIRYDLNFDAYSVSVKRLGDVNVPCENEFLWKLVIRPMGWYSENKAMPEDKQRNQNPTRYRKARNDASISSIQKTMEKKFGLPEGSVKLVNPNGRKIRSDATVGTLVSNWEKNG